MVYKRILVPIDGSSASNSGLREALKLAKDQRAKLRLLHIVDELVVFNTPEAGFNVESVIESMRRAGKRLIVKAQKAAAARGVRAEPVMIESAGARVADIVTRQARRWKADLIVMGTHGRRGVNRMIMGSDAELVVRNAPMPVLLVRSGSAR